MVEIGAALAGAIFTACFVSVGAISIRARENRDAYIRLTTSSENVEKRLQSMHGDIKDIYDRLNHVDRAVARLEGR